MQLAAQAPPLRIGALDHARARCCDLGFARAQVLLRPAALQLGGRAGSKDADRLAVLVGRVERLLALDGEQADDLTARAAQRDDEAGGVGG